MDRISFLGFELDFVCRQLRQADTRIPIEPRVFDVLGHLIRHRGRIVPQQELVDTFWAGDAVSDSALPRCISEARRLLGDRDRPHRIIATCRGYGYQFVAEVDETSPMTVDEDSGGVRPFVGRRRSLEWLHGILADVSCGERRFVLLSGESGIGKTELMRAFADRIKRTCTRSISVQSVDCVSAYHPWVEILRSLRYDVDPPQLERLLGEDSGVLAELDPELSDSIGSIVEPASLPPRQARARLARAMTRFVSKSARGTPVVILWDDLHLADVPSLKLLDALFQCDERAALMFVGAFTLSSPQAETGSQFNETRNLFCQHGQGEEWRLDGLTIDEVRVVTREHLGREPEDAALIALAEYSGGNPLYLGETLRYLKATQCMADAKLETELPAHLRDVIDRRLQTLGERTRRVLSAASVLGIRFRSDRLPALVRDSAEEIRAVLFEAQRLQLIRYEPSGVDCCFSHGLIQRALYERMSTPVRTQLHARVADDLSTCPSTPLAELAHHAFLAAPARRYQNALRHLVRAARLASRRLAFEEAVIHLRRALELLEYAERGPGLRGAVLRLALAIALRDSGDRNQAMREGHAVAEEARRLGDPDLLGRAAVFLGRFGCFGAGGDPRLKAMLEEAHRTLPPNSTALRARIVNLLVDQPPYSRSAEARSRLSVTAADLASQSRCSSSRLAALCARWKAVSGPMNTDERIAIATEIIEFGTAEGHPNTLCLGFDLRIASLLQAGAVDAAERDMAALSRAATQVPEEPFAWIAAWIHLSHRISTGDNVRADESRALRDWGDRLAHPVSAVVYHGQNVAFGIHQQDFTFAAHHHRSLLEETTWSTHPILAGLGAYIDAQLGREGRVRAAIERHPVSELELDESWLITVTALANAAVLIGERCRLEVFYEALIPYRQLFVVHELLRVSFGQVELHLAVLAAAMGDETRAERHLREADNPPALRLRFPRAMAETLHQLHPPSLNFPSNKHQAPPNLDAVQSQRSALG